MSDDAAAADPSPWADADTELFFAFVGRYVASFQWIEGQLDQILLLARGFGNWAATQVELANLRNQTKIERVNTAVLGPGPFERIRSRADWCEHFEKVIERLHAERQRRNSIVHSQFLMEFVEAGMPPIGSHRRRRQGEARFETQQFGRQTMDRVLAEVATLAFDVGQVRVQLIHIYQPDG